MALKYNAYGNRGWHPFSILMLLSLFSVFFLLGLWQRSGFAKGDGISLRITRNTDCNIVVDLNLEGNHSDAPVLNFPNKKAKKFKMCNKKYTDHTPCHEQKRAMTFLRQNMVYRERHCPKKQEKLRCIVPAPEGYKLPFPWPKGRDYIHYRNVPYVSLTVDKAVQNWVELQGDVFKFTGGGTMFPNGADSYIDEVASVIPIGDGSIRTALDTGCGVASWGAYLLKRNILTMSFAPKDNHEAQVQFALERGVPAIIGVLGTIRLPYPSRSFDMAQCSRCLIPWTSNDGMYLKEIDRLLRPGGYWILSGPPINWKTYYKTWKQTMEDARMAHQDLEHWAKLLCWDKMYEKGDIAIWRKKINPMSCWGEDTNICETGHDDVWYKKMGTCIMSSPEVLNENEVSGGELKKFPDRLFAVPPRILKEYVPGVFIKSYKEDTELWNKLVTGYKRINTLIGTTRYRNIMDMNAGFGGFAAALESPNLWVMNVVPSIAKNTLGIIFERGLIGIYNDWCEGFSTYPRTYDLIHSNGVFSLYKNRCDMEDIVLEMDRILRPEGVVIVRDDGVAGEMLLMLRGVKWDARIIPLSGGQILIATKPAATTDNK